MAHLDTAHQPLSGLRFSVSYWHPRNFKYPFVPRRNSPQERNTIKADYISMHQRDEHFDLDCYIDKNSLYVIRFVPEVDPVEVTLSKSDVMKYFPYRKNMRVRPRISNIGMYSIAKPDLAQKICRIMRRLTGTSNITVTDALGNVGGMTLAFAQHFKRVVSCEIVPLHCEMILHNVNLYNVSKCVEVLCGDYMSCMYSIQQEVIFFDPPWGGTHYKNGGKMSLAINNVNIACIIQTMLRYCEWIVMRVPCCYKFQDLKRLSTRKYLLKLSQGKFPQWLIVLKGQRRNLAK